MEALEDVGDTDSDGVRVASEMTTAKEKSKCFSKTTLIGNLAKISWFASFQVLFLIMTCFHLN